ncbi:hypothetical protein GGR55DRAFT_73300 [Xylaria sp. FL0064]|nr:hypothetical protein GGR55DRAFT_73300 [Xylaria sp. FL0064]
MVSNWRVILSVLSVCLTDYVTYVFGASLTFTPAPSGLLMSERYLHQVPEMGSKHVVTGICQVGRATLNWISLYIITGINKSTVLIAGDRREMIQKAR